MKKIFCIIFAIMTFIYAKAQIVEVYDANDNILSSYDSSVASKIKLKEGKKEYNPQQVGYSENFYDLFNGIKIMNGYIYIVLKNGSEIRVPYQNVETLTIDLPTPGQLSYILSEEQLRTTTEIVINGIINNDDLRTLMRMPLERAKFSWNYGILTLNPYGSSAPNTTLREIEINVVSDTNSSDVGLQFNQSWCQNLKKITTNATIYTASPNDVNNKLEGNEVLDTLIIHEGLTNLSSYIDSYKYADIPSTLTKINRSALANQCCRLKTIVCRAETPPAIDTEGLPSYVDRTHFIIGGGLPSNCLKNITLYVPTESVELYKASANWKQLGEIKSIEELK